MKKQFLAFIPFLFCVAALTQQPWKNTKYPSLLWEISGNGLAKKSYLVGTMHVSNKIAFHLPDSFYYACVIQKW